MSGTGSDTVEAFTAEERAAMKEHARDQKKAARRGSRADKAAEAARDVLAKIAEMQAPDRALAERVHAVITASAPNLAPRLWYGMPAYALDGKVVCFFQSAAKFKARYATLGFNDPAKLDDGPMWATAFALTEVTPGGGEAHRRPGEPGGELKRRCRADRPCRCRASATVSSTRGSLARHRRILRGVRFENRVDLVQQGERFVP